MNARADAGLLQRLPLFAECDRTHLHVLAFSAERVDFAPGEAVFRQGERGEAAYLVLQGTAEAFALDGDAVALVGKLEAGAFLGELAMIAGLPYSVSVVASSGLAAARIPRTLFMRVASEFPDFGVKVHRALARKLEHSVDGLKGVKSLFDAARPFSGR